MGQKYKYSSGIDYIFIGKKKPFATSTVATRDLLILLSEDGCTISELTSKIHYDVEAKSIVQKFIDEGYGKEQAKKFFWR